MYTPGFVYETRDDIPSPHGSEFWMTGYNAAILHFEDQLGATCPTAFRINDGLIGLDLNAKPDGDHIAHTSFHNHTYGQSFIVLSGTGELVVSHRPDQDYHKILPFEKGQMFHLPGNIYHQLRLPSSAREPIQYLCVRPAEWRYEQEICTPVKVENVVAHSIVNNPQKDLTGTLGSENMFQVTLGRLGEVIQVSRSDRLLIVFDVGKKFLQTLGVNFIAAGEKLIINTDMSQFRVITFETVQ